MVPALCCLVILVVDIGHHVVQSKQWALPANCGISLHPDAVGTPGDADHGEDLLPASTGEVKP